MIGAGEQKRHLWEVKCWRVYSGGSECRCQGFKEEHWSQDLKGLKKWQEMISEREGALPTQGVASREWRAKALRREPSGAFLG